MLGGLAARSPIETVGGRSAQTPSAVAACAQGVCVRVWPVHSRLIKGGMSKQLTCPPGATGDAVVTGWFQLSSDRVRDQVSPSGAESVC